MWCGERAECSRGFVAMWGRRFRAERLAGLYSRHRGQKPFRCTPSVEARILKNPRVVKWHYVDPSRHIGA